jgi:hypothetical protein
MPVLPTSENAGRRQDMLGVGRYVSEVPCVDISSFERTIGSPAASLENGETVTIP